MNLEEELFKEFLNTIYKFKEDKSVYIGLSWGNSIRSFYLNLKENFHKIPKYLRNKIIFFYLDERVVPFDSEQSNYKFTKELFLNYLIEEKFIKENQILIPTFDKTYLQNINKIQIWLIGVWEDGHIASLFPNTFKKQFKEMDNFILIDNSPKLPSKRFTCSFNLIKKIINPFVFFVWENKLNIYKEFLKEKNANKYPVCILKQNKNLIIFKNLL